MSQYNKTILTNAGLELAKRANAGQAKFGITRAVTSADDWSHKTVQDLEEATTIPNIMQQGTIMDTDEVESNNSVIGVSLCFTNKNLSTDYQIRVIGLYVKEEGQENDFLYAVTTAVSPEYMPDFNDKVLYRFNMQMYLVIGNAQSVNVVINEGTAVTHGQLDKYKTEVADNLKKLENTHKEDMSHVAKSASINGGAEILPDSTGKLNLVVPDPDLSKYVSLEQLGELLQAKADVADVNKQIKAVTDLANTKANTVDVDSKIKTVTDLANTKANSADVYTKTEVDSKTSGTIITDYDIASKTPTKRTDRYNNKWLVDQQVLGQFADAINDINGTWKRYTHDDGFDLLTLWGQYGIHYCHNDNMTNVPYWFGDKRGTAFVFTFDNNSQTIIYAGCVFDGFAYYNRLEGKWHKLANDNDITNLQNAVNSKANASDVYTKPQIDTAFGQRDTKIGNNTNVINTINEALKSLIPDDTHAPALPAGFDLNNYFVGWRRSVNTTLKNMPFGWLSDTMYFQGTVAGSDGRFEIALYVGNGPNSNPKIAYRFYGWGHWKPWVLFADNDDISNLQNQIQQLRESQFEVQTFTDANAAANWEAQRPGKRMAIVNQ